MDTNDVIIRTTGLAKYYGRTGARGGDQTRALDGLDLEVRRGETFGLLGPNGAGKTTTVRLLNCLITPSAGSAMVDSYSILEHQLEIKRRTGLVAETPGLYEKLTAFEFLEFMGALYDVPAEVLGPRIPELLALFGLDARRNQLLEGYSRGMKQKLLLAAALVHDPPVLFLDEPIAALDPRAAHTVKELIKSLAHDAKKTVFICSHILPFIEELCDRIGIIYQGRLVALGTVAQICARTKTDSLEAAFIALSGGSLGAGTGHALMAWRGSEGAG